jgi:hypothetical protein
MRALLQSLPRAPTAFMTSKTCCVDLHFDTQRTPPNKLACENKGIRFALDISGKLCFHLGQLRAQYVLSPFNKRLP